MNVVMAMMSLVYLATVFGVSRAVVSHRVHQADSDVLAARQTYQNFFRKKLEIFKEKKKIEQQASEIFTLYDLTKEVAKSFNEDDALNVFKSKLRESVDFEECRLNSPNSPEIKSSQEDPQVFSFLLKGRKRVLGQLSIRGVQEQDKDKVMILAQQFSLALRRIRLYQAIEQLAITDSVTEVYTRRYILEQFRSELSRSRAKSSPLSFLMVDVDFFKNFNDQHGHLTGDLILRKISKLIRGNVREIDIVGRYGGEEFCVVLPDSDQGGARYVAERIRSAVEKHPIKAYDSLVNATVSIGTVSFPQDGKALDELVDKADWALFRAKKLGRNMVCSFGIYNKS